MAAEQKLDGSFFDDIKELPPDAIFNTKARFTKDQDPSKVNLGIGAYRDDDGKPMVLKVVRKVEKMLSNEEIFFNKEYLPITGDQEFVRASQELVFGRNSPVFTDKRIVGAQGLSGTGSLRILFAFIHNNMPTKPTVWISNPTWGNHKKIINKANLSFETYSYWDPNTRGLNIEGMLNDLDTKTKPGDVVLLHLCAHNPTGVDPKQEEWKRIADVIQKRKLVPFFDSAYQGFATGSLDNDAYALRLFVERGMNLLLAQSFSKNMGLYCERIGCASIVAPNAEVGKACMTQLAAVIRPMYSNPPAHGARIVKTILGKDELRNEWIEEMKKMSNRIISVRTTLKEKLEELKTPGTWDHITQQIGMFTFTGLTPEQVDVMESKYHIYMLRTGRISMAGVCNKNAEYVAKAMDDVVRNVKKSKI